MDYGFNTPASVVDIPQGSGFLTFGFFKNFPAGTGTYAQRATIVETGGHSTATTVSGGGGGGGGGGGRFRGTMTVTGNATTTRTQTNPGGGTSTAVGNPGSGMDYCSLTPGASATAVRGTVTVGVVATTGTCASGLVNGVVYDINYANGRGFYDPVGPTYGYGWRIDCMSPISAGQVKLGQQTAASGGIPTATYNLPTSMNNAANEDAAICVSTQDGSSGNQAPVQIVTV